MKSIATLTLPLLLTTIVALPAAAQNLQASSELSGQFHELVRASDLDGVKKFLEANPVYKNPDWLGPAARLALQAQDEPMARALVEMAETPEAQVKAITKYPTLLEKAATVNSGGMVSYLLEKSADYYSRTPDGGTVYAAAVKAAFNADRPDRLRQLLEFQNPAVKKSLQSPVKISVSDMLPPALASGNAGLVKAILAQGPDFREQAFVEKVWIAAMVSGDMECTKALAAAMVPTGAEAKPRSAEMLSTGLVEAARAGRAEAARFLIGVGANPGRENQRNTAAKDFPLITAIRSRSTSIAEALIDGGASVNPAGWYRVSPLATALTTGQFNLARRLVEKGALLKGGTPTAFDLALKGDIAGLENAKDAINDEDDQGLTALHAAAAFGGQDLLGALRKLGAKAIPDRTGRSPLMWAAWAGNLPAAQWFLAHGARATATDLSGQSALHYAAASGSGPLVDALLAAGANPNAAETTGNSRWPGYERGTTPLHRAALYGNVPAVQALLRAKADANAVTASSMTPLSLAALSGQAEAVKTLLAAGASVKSPAAVDEDERRLNQSNSPLMSLAREVRYYTVNEEIVPGVMPASNRVTAAKALIAAGADVREVDPKGYTPIMVAVANSALTARDESWFFDEIGLQRWFWRREKNAGERAQLIAALAQGGVDVNRAIVASKRGYEEERSGYGSAQPAVTALQLAVDNVDLASVRALLDNGANPNLENSAGRTALDFAARRGENSRNLVDEGFAVPWSPSAFDEAKPASLLVGDERRTAMVQALIAKGGRPGRGPFFRAISWGAYAWVKQAVEANPELLKLTADQELLQDKAVRLSVTWDGFVSTPASQALDSKHFRLARLLIEKGAPTGPQGSTGENLLFYAARAKDWETLDLLLKRGVSWQAETSYNMTPILMAARTNQVDTLKELVKRGAKLDDKNKEGMTPLTVATINGNTAAAEYLRSINAPR